MIREQRWHDEEREPAEHLPEEREHWALRFLRWVIAAFRPHLGWLVLLTTMALAWFPALGLGENRIEEMRRIQATLDLVGPSAVVVTWWLLGWRAPRPGGPRGGVTALGRFFLLTLIGLLVLSQSLIGWLPGPGEVGQTLLSGAWPTLFQNMATDWLQLFTRLAIWWQGVRSGGAAQDNLIFAAIAGLLFWNVGALTAWLLRRFERGLAATLPVLWLLGTLLLYSGVERGLMLGGVSLAVILHLLLDQRHLTQRWQAQGLDFAPDLALDRMMVIGGLGLVLFLVAAVMPNLYYRPLVVRYYQLIEPIDEEMEAFRGRLFPDLAGISRRAGASAGGLPNAFLLSGSVDLGENVVMQVRSNETAAYEYAYYDAPYMEMEGLEPPGHYMRGATLTRYDGHGWDNLRPIEERQFDANTGWMPAPTSGRRELVQSVTLFVNSPVLYAAPEPLEAGVAYEAQLRADGDLIALQQRARTYTIISAIPEVSEAMLEAAPAWDDTNPLPAAFTVHLDLPATVTARTRELAGELTAGQTTTFAKAKAIEQFLRQYEYDLEVPEPPDDVIDIADYFLFELQRGYCDYYATAFIVLARAVGIPARFATGYAVGYWNPNEAAFIVTESEAHSWPEVYFPDYGWIPFEPTAGRPELAR
ncbi:MAG: transglutaminase domain-containing protein, partial [Caldilineaceae bacterium]|nr:transglutaminase domain-containing protein [Caldilineaceae bacterium]